MEFIKDRWYKYNDVYEHYFKVSENQNENDVVNTLEDIHTGEYRKLLDRWHVNPNTKEVFDLSEISKYLPDGHIDKIIINKTIDTSYLIEVFDKLKIK
jgi:hypothetical protein